MNKSIKIEIAVGVVLLLAVLIGGAFLIQNRKIQTLEQSQQDLSNQLKATGVTPVQTQQAQASKSEVVAPVTNVPETTIVPVIQNPAPQSDPKVAIHFTIKDKSGKLMKGILCDVTTNNKSYTKMVTITSKKSDSDGKCFFEKLDQINPYLVRVYWTSDKSRVSDVSLSFIPAGTTVVRDIIKPANM